MKKIAIAASFLAFGMLGFSSNSVQAQATMQGEHLISFAYGFGNLSQSVFQAYEDSRDYEYRGVGPLFLKYEYMIEDKVGIGLNVAYVGANVSWTEDNIFVDDQNTVLLQRETDRTSYSVLGRVNFHIGDYDIVDPYVGFGIGYRDASWTSSDNDPERDWGGDFGTSFNVGFELTGGARFMFSDHLGAFAEVGFAKAWTQIGITAKL